MKFRKSCKLLAKNWNNCFPPKNTVKSRGTWKSGWITSSARAKLVALQRRKKHLDQLERDLDLQLEQAANSPKRSRIYCKQYSPQIQGRLLSHNKEIVNPIPSLSESVVRFHCKIHERIHNWTRDRSRLLHFVDTHTVDARLLQSRQRSSTVVEDGVRLCNLQREFKVFKDFSSQHSIFFASDTAVSTGSSTVLFLRPLGPIFS